MKINKIHFKNWFTNINKMKLFAILGSVVVTAGVITPVVLNTVNKNQAVAKQKYQYDGQVFESKDALFEYAQSVASKDTSTHRNRWKWSIQYNNKTLEFNNIKDLNDFIANKIITRQAATSLNIETAINGEINTSDYADLNLDQANQWATIEIFRGKDNTFFASEQSAKDSYLQIHDAFLFDGIFFRTEEELAVYLNNNSDTITNKDDSIVIIDPNSTYSQPILANSLAEPATQKYIQKFVETNSKQYLQVKTTESDSDLYKYYDKQTIQSNLGNILVDYNDPAYVSINSNQGKPNFVVDLDVNDAFDLYGPYYTKSSAALKKITDTNSWRKIEDKDQSFIDNQKETQLFSAFLESIIAEDDQNSEYPFNFGDVKDSNDKRGQAIKNYFESLKKDYPHVYKSVIELNNHMKKGKRYSAFYKLPILFIHTLEKLVYFNCPQNVIETARDFYIYVADYYDSKIKTIIPAFFLKNSRNENKTFSLIDIFKFNKYNLDLNVDVESYMDTITEEYPNLLKMSEYTAIMDAFSVFARDVFEFDLAFIDRLFKTSYNKQTAETKKWYEEIWNAYTSPELDVVKASLTSICKSNQILDPQTLIDEWLVKYIFPKEIATTNIKIMMQSDLAFINSDKYDPSAPNQSQFKTESFFYNLTAQKTAFFKTLIAYNDNVIDLSTLGLLKLIALKQLNPWKPMNQNDIFANPQIKYSAAYKLSLDRQAKLLLIDFESFHKSMNKLYGWDLLIASYVMPYDQKNYGLDIWKTFNKSANAINQILGVMKDFGDIFDNFLRALEVFTKITKLLSCLFKSLPFVSIFLTILVNLYSTEEYSYIFDSEDVKYIWNGGKTDSWFFGMISNTITDINSMQMLAPYQVTEQHIEFGKYYNKTIYSDDNLLKKQQLVDILNKQFNSNTISIVYSFRRTLEASYDNPSPLAFKNFGQIDDDITTDLVDYVYNDITTDQSTLTKNIYSFGNGYTFDQSTSIDANIKKIINNIEPSKIVTIPTLVDNYPISGSGSGEDGSIPVYRLPNRSWTASGGFFENTSNVEYIIIDPNRKDLPPLSSAEMIDTIKSIFYDAFTVDFKSILKTDLYKYDTYSDYRVNVNKFYVYEAVTDTGYTKMFKDKSDAFAWLLSEVKFTVYDTFNSVDKYSYKDQVFKSLDTYLEWVLNTAEEV